jgi:hypothetical protein
MLQDPWTLGEYASYTPFQAAKGEVYEYEEECYKSMAVLLGILKFV